MKMFNVFSLLVIASIAKAATASKDDGLQIATPPATATHTTSERVGSQRELGHIPHDHLRRLPCDHRRLQTPETPDAQWYYDGKPLEDGLHSVFATSQLPSMLWSAALEEPGRRLLNPREGGVDTGSGGGARSLAALTEMNELLKDVTLHIVKVVHWRDLGLDGVGSAKGDVLLHDLICKDIGIKDLTLSSTTSGNKVDLKLSLTGISVACAIQLTTCDVPWWIPGIGDGDNFKGRASTYDSSLTSVVSFSSSDLARFPPDKAAVGSCTAGMKFHDFNLIGISKATIEGFSEFISNFKDVDFNKDIEDAVGKELCGSKGLPTLAADPLTDLMKKLTKFLNPYMPCQCAGCPPTSAAGGFMPWASSAGGAGGACCIKADGCAGATTTREVCENKGIAAAQWCGALHEGVHDALWYERQPPVAAAAAVEGRLIDYEGMAGDLVSLVQDGLDWLGKPDSEDPAAGLGINVGMRQIFLDEGGNLQLEVGDFFANEGIVLEDSTNPIMHIKIGITDVHIAGLDTFSKFDPFQVIGPHTLQHDVKLDSLDFIAHFTIHIRPSGAENKVVHGGGEVVEHVKITAGVRGLAMEAATLLAFERADVEGTKVGSLIPVEYGGTGTMTACALATVLKAGLSRMNVNVDDVTKTALSGFIGPGVDHIFTGMAEAVYLMFEEVIKLAMPNIFEVDVRDAVNKIIDDTLADAKAGGCAVPAAPASPPTDLFNFHTDPTWAYAVSLIDEHLGAAGGFKINSLILSGLGGESGFAFEKPAGEPFAFAAGESLTLGLAVTNLAFKDIASIYELAILKPAGASDPTGLANRVKLAKDVPMVAGVDVTLTVGGAGPDEKVARTFSLSLSARQVALLLDLGVRVSKARALNVELGGAARLPCWLAAFVQDEANDGLGVSGGSLSFGSFVPSVTCDACTVPTSKPKLAAQNAAWRTARGSKDVTATLNAVLVDVLDYLKGEFARPALRDMVANAALECATPGAGTQAPSYAPTAVAAPAAAAPAAASAAAASDPVGIVVVAALLFGRSERITFPVAVHESVDVAGFMSVSFDVTDFACDELEADLSVNSVGPDAFGKPLVEMTVAIANLNAKCSLAWSYRAGTAATDVLADKGTVEVSTENSKLTIRAQFTSADFGKYPPSSAAMKDCVPLIDFSFQMTSEGLTSIPIAEVNAVLQGIVKTEAERLVCEELRSAVDDALAAELLGLSNDMTPYLPCPCPDEEEALLSGPGACPQYCAFKSASTDLLALERAMKAAGPLPDSLVKLKENYVATTAQQLIEDNLGPTTRADGTPTLGVNEQVKKLLDADGAFKVDVSTLVEGGAVYGGGPDAPLTISLKEARVGGLDSFTVFSPMVVVGDYTVSHAIAMARLDVAVDVAITVRPDKAGALDGAVPRTTTFEVSAGASGLSVKVAELIAVDAALVDEVRVGSLLPAAYYGTDSLLPCLLTTVHDAGFAQLEAAVADLTMPAVSGLGGSAIAGLDAAVSDLLKGAEFMFEGAALRALPALLETTVRADLNAQIGTLRATAAASCKLPAPPKHPDADHFVFDDNALWDMAVDGFDAYLGAASGFQVNDLLIGPATTDESGTPGTLTWPGMDAVDAAAGPLGRLKFDVGAISLSGLDTVYEMKMLDPTGPHTLTNRVALGKAPPVALTLGHVKFSVTGGSGDNKHAIDNTLKLTLSMEQVLAVADFLVKIDIGKVVNRKLGEVTTINCWLATISKLEVTDLALSFARFAPKVECVQCSSPKMHEMSANLNDEKNVAQLTKAMNDWIAYLIKEFKGVTVDKTIDDTMRSAHAACPTDGAPLALEAEAATPPPTADEKPETNVFTILGPLAGVAFAGVCVCCARFRRQKRRADAGEEAAHAPDEEELAEQLRKDAGLRASRSLFRSVHVIPWFARWFIPLVLMVNIGFFVSGHIALGASVDINIDIAGERIVVPSFFEFSLAKSTIEMWKAGAKPLAVLIVIFSGLWPYTKMLLMLFCWFAGPGCLGPRRRGAIFIWLDVLGKWSMIDIFVLFVSLVSFRLHMESPSTMGFLPRGFYTVDLAVVPMWGLYANLLAQLMSQFVSHAAIYYHRNVVAAAEALVPPEGRPSCLPWWVCRIEEGKCIGLPEVTIGDRSASSDSNDDFTDNAIRVDRTRARRNSYAPHARGSKMKRANTARRKPAGPGGAAPTGGPTKPDAQVRMVEAYAPASPRKRGGRKTPRHVDFVETTSAEWADNPISAQAARKDWRENPMRSPLRGRHASTWLQAGTAADNEVTDADVGLVDVKEALCNHVFEVAGTGHRFRITRRAKMMLMTCVAGAFGLIVAGCSIPGFRVEAAGLVGVVMDFGEGEGARTKRLSVFGVADIIAAHAGDTFESAAGIYLLGVVFVMCTLAVPLMQLLALTTLWVRPMTLAQQKKVFVVNEILSAWQYLEVYLIAIIVAVLQLGQVSGFMVGDQCEALETMFESMEEFGLIEARDATCFVIHSGILSGAYLLLAGAVLLNISCQFVTRGAGAAMADREARNKGRPATPHLNCFTWFVWRGLREVAAPLQTAAAAAAAAAGQVELTEAAIVAKQETALAHPTQPRLAKKKLRVATTAGALPRYWEKLVDQESGKDYYFNHRTGQSSWERPLHPEELAAQVAARKAARTPRHLQHAISSSVQRKRGNTTVSVV